MKTVNILGFDFGASSGRAMLGTLLKNRLTIEEIHRFSNDPVKLGGRLVWDVERLFFEMLASLKRVAKAGVTIDAIGIDTWGVDYGLLDKCGNLVSQPVHYRDARTDGMMEAAFKILPKEEIFEKTGLAFMGFNTLYQLLAMKAQDDPALKIADKLLFMPDLLAYFLTGKAATEYTIASTSQLVDPHARTWSEDIIRAFDLPAHLLTEIQAPGAVRGTLLKEIADEVGLSEVPVIAVCSHDTASAVAAVPAEGENFAYLSSGTWSLLGAEVRAPICTREVLAANYTNEGGVDQTTRLLKNIMGLWMIQELKREWDQREGEADFAEIVRLADEAEPFIALLDVDDQRFIAPGGMEERIEAYCKETNQRVPRGRGEFARVVYESLALKYRWGVETLSRDMLKKPVSALHIVGGGSKNEMLNQFTADALNMDVNAGPSEGTVIGNLLVQAMALGAVKSLEHLRQIVKESFPPKVYRPSADRARWDGAYEEFLKRLGGARV